MAEPLVQMLEVRKSYSLGARVVEALRGVTLRLEKGAFVVVQGPSGSGKTTLLNLLGCVDKPTAGRVLIGGCDSATLSDDELSRFRATRLGFVFQTFNLVPVLSAAENIEYPLLLNGVPRAQARERALAMLDELQLRDQATQRPAQLSGGQSQRVAIGRALINEPELVIADEPTANLDSKTGRTIIELMRQLQQRLGTAFVISTHDPEVAEVAGQRLHMRDGLLT